MKTSEEMAQSVMERARIHKIVKKRRIITVTAAFLCVCVIGITAATAQRSPDPEPDTLQVQPTTDTTANNTVTIPIGTHKVTMLRYLSGGTQNVALEQDVKTPCQMAIRVRDLRGLTEAERKAACAEERENAQDMVDQYGEDLGDYQWYQLPGTNGVVTSICAGAFLFRLDDPALVESFHVSLSGAGKLGHIPGYYTEEDKTLHFNEYYLDSKEVRQYYHYGGINIVWLLHDNICHDLTIDPTVPLSTYQDTITVIITFKDGTVETHVIDIEIEDSGAVYAIYRGENATVS